MEKITVNAEPLVTISSKNDWIRSFPRAFPQKLYYNEEFLFVDSQGNILVNGEDFSAAEELESYPVKVYRMQRSIWALNQKSNS